MGRKKKNPKPQGEEVYPWYAAYAALKSREQDRQQTWEQSADKFCPCGRFAHTPRCEKRIKQAVEALQQQRALKEAVGSLYHKGPGRPPDWPLHLLIAAKRVKEQDRRLTDKQIVERFCPCMMDHPTRRRHTRECLEAYRRAMRTFKARLQEFGPASRLLSAGRGGRRN